MTNKERFTDALRGLLEAGVKVAEIAENLGVHKDTVYAWKGTNAKRHISEATATKLMAKLKAIILQYLQLPELPKAEATTEVQAPAADRFKVFQPEQTEQTITVKQLAEILAITPKSLRRCLRKKYGKAQDGVWTLTLKVVEEVKAVFIAKGTHGE